eukprot:GHVP01031306.1.p2 GENE.GHVP01031306.1~~GHVP01031306.1.p2  ORF type:complete len:354 (+),score=75.14 GHVP01031306.1:3575-4636(+)
MIRIRGAIDREEDICRPFLSKESGNGHSEKLRAVELRQTTGKKKIAKQVYRFDQIFPADSFSGDIFDGPIKRCALASLDGQRTSVFSYGESGSGKTYTLLGSPKTLTLGVLQLAVMCLVERMRILRESGYEFETDVLALEVCQGEFRTMILDAENSKSSSDGINVVQLPKNSKSFMGRMEFKPCPSKRFHSYQEALEILEKASANRMEKRSHAIFQLRITKKLGKERTFGSVTFVDLAASERLDPGSPKFDNDDTKQVNLSLCHLGHALSQVRQLGNAGEAPETEPPPGIFRCCRLSWALRDCLGCQADSRSVLVAHVSASPQKMASSRNTLNFADALSKGRFSKHPLDTFSG